MRPFESQIIFRRKGLDTGNFNRGGAVSWFVYPLPALFRKSFKGNKAATFNSIDTLERHERTFIQNYSRKLWSRRDNLQNNHTAGLVAIFFYRLKTNSRTAATYFCFRNGGYFLVNSTHYLHDDSLAIFRIQSGIRHNFIRGGNLFAIIHDIFAVHCKIFYKITAEPRIFRFAPARLVYRIFAANNCIHAFNSHCRRYFSSFFCGKIIENLSSVGVFLFLQIYFIGGEKFLRFTATWAQ